jgi:hypothetical protein
VKQKISSTLQILSIVVQIYLKKVKNEINDIKLFLIQEKENILI